MALKFVPASLPSEDSEQFMKTARDAAKVFQMPLEDVLKTLKEDEPDSVWISTCGTYQVQVRTKGIISPELLAQGFPEMIWLSCKRSDRQPIADWRVMQQIKNAIVGTENEGVEIYPAESRLVDTANQYHIWVMKEPGIRFPFGFQERAVKYETIGDSVQRPFTAKEEKIIRERDTCAHEFKSAV